MQPAWPSRYSDGCARLCGSRSAWSVCSGFDPGARPKPGSLIAVSVEIPNSDYRLHSSASLAYSRHPLGGSSCEVFGTEPPRRARIGHRPVRQRLGTDFGPLYSLLAFRVVFVTPPKRDEHYSLSERRCIGLP